MAGAPSTAYPMGAVPRFLGLGLYLLSTFIATSHILGSYGQLESSRASPENGPAPGNFTDYTVAQGVSGDNCLLAFVVPFMVGIWGQRRAEDKTRKG